MEFLNYIFTQELDKIIAFAILIIGVIIYTIVEYKEV
jgi:hypothetical protein